MIHPTAIVHPDAQIGPGVRIGPCAVIDKEVTLGPDCVVGPHVYITGHTSIGVGNRFFAGCVIGEIPQDLKYSGAPSRLRIGDHNSFRENVTVNLATTEEEDTVVGSRNLLMAGVHIAHNCCLGSNIIMANGCMLGGHVQIGDRAVISGNCLVHQFVRVGTFAMMQGGSAISKDLAPFTVARWTNRVCGLNMVGLRRGGFNPTERMQLRQLYKMLFRGNMNLGAAAAAARSQFPDNPAKLMLDFIATSKRGVCVETYRGERIDDDSDEV